MSGTPAIGAILLLTAGLASQPVPAPAAQASPQQQETPAPSSPAATQAPGRETAAPAAPAEESQAAPTPKEPGSHEAAPQGRAEPQPHAGAEAAETEHAGPAEILMHHVVDVRYGNLYIGPVNAGPSKHLMFFLVAAALVVFLVRLARRGYEEGIPTGLGAAVEALVVFVRDEIAEKNIGHDGHRYVPLLLSFFFFILVAALLGLVPVPSYSFATGRFSISGTTSTGNLSVTMGLALVSFLAQQYAGISKFGLVHHFMGMVPAGMPKALLPIMIPVEILGMFTKPFALMIRLFANMLAGHMVITTLLLLIPLMASISSFFGISMIPVSLGLGLFIMFLELLVAFIQAFIFTLLTAIFIGMYAHPSH